MTQTVGPRILYFVPEQRALDSGVLHAQVLSPAQHLAKLGFECMFIGSDVSDEKAAQATKYIVDTYGIPAKVFGCYSAAHGLLSLVLTARKTGRLAKDLIRDFKPTHVYTRSLGSSRIGRKIAAQNGALSVRDIRGLTAEEIALRRGGNRGIAYRLALWMALNEIRRTDRLSCVSHNLKRWIEKQSGRKDVTVIPCCIDKNKIFFDAKAREQIRKRYGFKNNNKVICYAGGLATWQRMHDIVQLLGEISRLNKNYRFLFLTREDRKLRAIVEGEDIPLGRCLIVSCSHNEIRHYLSAADAGIIMRYDILVNNVASPIKIGEYLGCGLPVILTKGIGDFSDRISEAEVGIALDENDDMARQVIDFMEQPHFGELRDRAIAFSHAHLSFEAYRDDYGILFHR